jgi:hypothetical protein
MAAAERECLAATTAQVIALGAETGMGEGILVIFHAAPRGDAVWSVDDQDCSRDDAVLQAVDLSDVSGRRVRLTPEGIGPIAADAELPRPRGSFDHVGGCFAPVEAEVEAENAVGAEVGIEARADAPVAGVAPCLPAPPLLGGPVWQHAVLTWLDLHRALTYWTGRALAATLVVAPETGDVASLDPLFCPDRGQDFEVITSLRLGPETVPPDEVDAVIANALDEHGGVNADLVELDLRMWLDAAGLGLPGFPAHGPGECESSAEGR